MIAVARWRPRAIVDESLTTEIGRIGMSRIFVSPPPALSRRPPTVTRRRTTSPPKTLSTVLSIGNPVEIEKPTYRQTHEPETTTQPLQKRREDSGGGYPLADP